MLRWLCNSWGSFTAAEIAAVENLCLCHQRLIMDGAFVDLRSEAGYEAAVDYLSAIDRAAQVMCLEAAPRSYRESFSLNYKALFPDNQRHFRVDVLEASVEQHGAIWVNGEQFELSPEAMLHAVSLQEAWANLASVLVRFREGAPSEVVLHPSQSMVQKPVRAEVASAVAGLDLAWTHFECQYISELIAIEERARQQIIDAVTYDQQLRVLPQTGLTYSAQRAEAERQLVRCIARLNSVANFKRKGRDDLGVEILHSALEVMRRCTEPGRKDALRGGAREAAHCLAFDVVASYDAMRQYLCEVSRCLERVDPHLCNNPGLVARLADWEESWEVGARYVLQTDMFEGICDLIAQIKSLTTLAPMLVRMCEDCDVELFLVLPRLVLLCFLADPGNRRAELVKGLLPHHFVKIGHETGAGLREKLDYEFEGLLSQFRNALQVLASSPFLAVAPGGPHAAAWEVTVRRAILGAAEAGDAYSNCPSAAKSAVEDMMRNVEKWSLELQRHCPEDWNQFSSVFVQCLVGGKHSAAPASFQV